LLLYVGYLKCQSSSQVLNTLHITARQYGEVVLPDAASGNCPGTPSRLRREGHKAVTVQGGYGALFAVRVQSFVSITRVAVQAWSEPGIYPRLQIWLRALAQCRGTICIGARNLSGCRI